MKKLLTFALLFLLCGCGISDDCIKSAGTVRIKEIDAAPFERIFVFPGISLVVTEGSEYSVSIKAGENFIDDISATIADNTLKLQDDSGCNWVREYGQTIVYVTAPNIIEIYSNTDRTISSEGTLTFPILRLYAMDIFGGVGTGDFIMDVSNQQLVVESNNIASFFITGNTQELLLNFYDDLGRFEGGDFQAVSVVVFQRSANDMIVHPIESISGNIYSTGNVISKTQPPTVNVIEHYTGSLIFD